MKALEHLVRSLTIFVGGSILVLMMGVIGADVALRTLTGQSIAGTAEVVANYFMVGVSFFPIAYAQLENRHIEATVLTDRMNDRGKLIARIIGLLFSLFVYGALSYATYFEAMKKFKIGAVVESGTLRIPIWACYWILPISFGLMCVVVALQLCTIRKTPRLVA